MIRKILLYFLARALAAPPPRPPTDLLDGRECDKAAFERLVSLLQAAFGELPRGRLLRVAGNGGGVHWVAITLGCPGGHTAYLRKEFSDPKLAQNILNWWSATGLLDETDW